MHRKLLPLLAKIRHGSFIGVTVAGHLAPTIAGDCIRQQSYVRRRALEEPTDLAELYHLCDLDGTS
jgi:hypothetical protein